MTALDIITQCRYRLGDTNTTGWTDDRLLALVDQGQRDLATATSIIKGVSDYVVASNSIITLPDEALVVERIEESDIAVPLFSREYIDSLKLRETKYTEGSQTGSRLYMNDTVLYNYCIKDNLNRLDIEVVIFSEEEIADNAPPKTVRVYYSVIPNILTQLSDVLQLDMLWFTALTHFVVGKARQDDTDEGSYQIGDAELKQYELEKQKALAVVKNNYAKKQQPVRLTTYKGLHNT